MKMAVSGGGGGVVEGHAYARHPGCTSREIAYRCTRSVREYSIALCTRESIRRTDMLRYAQKPIG